MFERRIIFVFIYNMKLPKNFIKMLENKYVLYFVLFLAVTNLLGYLVFGNINAVIFFILVGFLVYNFSKNMIIVLTVPLILTSILMIGKTVKEGLENANATATDSTTSGSTTASGMPDTKTDSTTSGMPSASTGTSTTSAMPTSAMPSTLSQIKAPGVAKPKTTTKEEDENTTESTDVIPKAQEHFQSDGTNKKRNNRIDYAATVEDAYGDLNKILGGDGVKRLTQDTQQLMTQQLQLADAMKNMTPLLEQAKGMLKGFDFKELGGLANIAKNFGAFGGAPPQE